MVSEAEMHRRQRDNILAALQKANWKISGRGSAADFLGIKPSTLAYRMKAMGIEKPS